VVAAAHAVFFAIETSQHRVVSGEPLSMAARVYVRATSVCAPSPPALWRTTWRLDSERPNVSRSFTHCRVRSRQRCAVAYACTASPSRSDWNCCMICTKPEPASPTRFATGTRTSANDSSAVSEQRQPILSSRLETVKPGVPRSTTSSETPPYPSSPVRTAVVTKSARTPDVM
jgi:hypothetical protein